MSRCTEYNAECKRGCGEVCRAKDLYRPSNGTEGMQFMSEFCDHCIHENHEKGKFCKIVGMTMALDPFEEGYPTEWKYDALGHPTCTAYVNWNWDTDGDPDDPDNPKAPPPPPDPNQLHLFPLYPNEGTFAPKIIHNQFV